MIPFPHLPSNVVHDPGADAMNAAPMPGCQPSVQTVYEWRQRYGVELCARLLAHIFPDFEPWDLEAEEGIDALADI